MSKSLVSVVKYEKPLDSVRKAVDLVNLFEDLEPDMKIFVKPNVVYWNRYATFPKWGMLTTSRVVEDTIVLLKGKGINDITIGEGIVTEDLKATETAADAFEKLGYNLLKERYGVKIINTFERPFEKIDMGLDFSVKINSDALHSDYIVNLPVLKTHSQVIVSLGMKNLKGLINIASRKKFHNADREKNLHYNIAKLPDSLPPCLTILDGIYTLERGPTLDGKARRSDILVASKNIFSADIVGTKLLGLNPSEVIYFQHVAKNKNRPLDLSDIEVVGEKIEDLASHHEWDYIYCGDDDIPLPLDRIGVKGLKYHKYDDTMCTYCSGLNGILLLAIKYSWKGKPYNNIEFLTGKRMMPTPGNNKTILVGQCQYNLNKDNPLIKELIPIQGCPPSKDQIKEAFKKCGIKVLPAFFKSLEKGVAFMMQKYKGKPEFIEDFYQVK